MLVGMDANDLPSTWSTRDLPMLRACLRRLDSGEVLPDLDSIQEEAGLDRRQMDAAIEALTTASPPYVIIHGNFLRSVGERTRRELGTWPTPESVLEGLVAAFSQAADDEMTEVQKGRLRAAADAIGGFGREVAIAALGGQLGRLG